MKTKMNKNFKKSCGRPNAPEHGTSRRIHQQNCRRSSVLSTLGPPNEEKSILGHLDKQSFEEVYFGEKFNDLRKAHNEKDFDRIDYCKDCDFLYEDPEILIWTNDKTAKVNHMLGTDDDFILTDYS